MTTAAPSPLYRWFAAHTRLVDRVTAGVAVLLTSVLYLVTLLLSGDTPDQTGPRALLLAVNVALVLPLAWRRTRPVAATAVVLVVCLIQVSFGIEVVLGQFAVLVLISALAAYGPRWSSWAGLALGLAGIVAATLRYILPGIDLGNRGWVLAIPIVAGWSVVGISWVLGDLTRSRRLEKEALADRADRAERERARDLQLAAAEERAHIARELHDIVAHSLSVVVTQADGARYAAPPSAGPVLPALEAIAETARTSLADMRRLLGVLRDGEETAPVAPAEGLADLPRLIDTVRGSGLRVRFVTPDPASLPPLSPGAQLVLFRVVQESLTNVLKHAGPDATADVTLTAEPDALEIRIRDDGLGSRADGREAHSGHGLLGMRERVALYHGDVSAGPRAGRGFEVIARLPWDKEAVGGR